MAIAAVKATKASAASNSVSFSVSATAGNALIVGGGTFNGTAWTVTRTGDTYTNDTTGVNSNNRYGISSAPNVAGGSVSMTVACASGSSVSAHALELSGLPTSGIRDAASPGAKTGTGTTPSSNSLASVSSDAVFVAAFADGAGANPASITPGGGWTATVGATTMSDTDGQGSEVCGQVYQIVTAQSTKTASWTVGQSAAWACGIAVYKMAAAAVATAPPPYHKPLRIWRKGA